LVGNLDWRFDMASGLLSFGERFAWHVQILGTQSDESATWLWGWDNQLSEIPVALLSAAKALKNLGECHRIPELTEPRFPLTAVDGHFLSTLGSGFCNALAYYRAPYEGGAAFLLIVDNGVPEKLNVPLTRIVSIFTQALTAFNITNHKTAWRGYLHYLGLAGETQDNTIIIKQGELPVLIVTFDECARLIHLGGQVG
jgi:hypothetical protein